MSTMLQHRGYYGSIEASLKIIACSASSSSFVLSLAMRARRLPS